MKEVYIAFHIFLDYSNDNAEFFLGPFHTLAGAMECIKHWAKDRDIDKVIMLKDRSESLFKNYAGKEHDAFCILKFRVNI